MSSPSIGTPRPRLLLVDDDEDACRLLGEVLERESYTVTRALSAEEAIQAIDREGRYDAVLTDLRMPGTSGLGLLRTIRERDPEALVFVLTAFGDATAAGEAIRAGAYDFISKPYDINTLRIAIGRALERRRVAVPLEKMPLAGTPLGDELTTAGSLALVGHSPAIIEVMKTVARVAPSQATVLITGETGTGKELIARIIHKYSDRANRRFVAVNCSALAEGLLESELFGHVKGAFTGAAGARPGLFREADKGTIFLDEIGDISPALQSRLLRVLQEHEIQPVGAEATIPVDVRVIAATHNNLETLVRENRFRADLYYRLNVVTLELPPLRTRRQDLPLLINFFLVRLGAHHNRGPVAVDPEALHQLLIYDWPGNVRELHNVLERALVLAAQDVIGPEHLPADLRRGGTSAVIPAQISAAGSGTGDAPTSFASLADVERLHVLRVLQETGGNRDRASQILGISRRTLSRMLQRWGMTKA